MAISITTESLPNGCVGQFYSFQLAAQVDPPSDILWAVENELPSELTLDTNSGIIKGMCTQPDLVSLNFTAQSTKTGEFASRVLTLYIAKIAKKLVIETTSLPNGIVGQTYTAKLIATGGIIPYHWTVQGLPSDLRQSDEQISGTPTTPSISNLNVQVKDSANPANLASTTISLLIVTPLQITTTSLVAGTAEKIYSQSLSASGGIPPYTWTGQSLPSELSVKDDCICGIPQQAGQFQLTIKVADSATPSAEESTELGLFISSSHEPLTITTDELAVGKVGKPYTQELKAAGGVPPYVWRTDSLPKGLYLNGDTILGQPTVSGGKVAVEVTVSDSTESCYCKQFWLKIVQ